MGEAEIPIDAYVAACEQPVLVAAAEQLSECLGAGDAAWPVRLDFGAQGAATQAGAIAVVSLLGDVGDAQRPMADVARDWRARVVRLTEGGYATIVLCTVFGFVADPGSRAGLMERIRRLNLLGVALSHEFGVGIADLDRIFTVFGARECRTDYRLGGRIAAEMAGHAIVTTILALGLDRFVPAEVQEAARVRHGGFEQIEGLIARRVGAA